MSDPLDEKAIELELDAMKELAKLLAPLSPEIRRKLLDWGRQFATGNTRAVTRRAPTPDVAGEAVT